ncbi:hypothetical protein BN970_04309 [Mycolicibacterium conceptionense]|uniref:Uncharacterized protein n=1 Tax=Mycolicibacterium conceptionense TaxID=451644 RepID=A0A0U1DMC9_9MYCO|nr:hypothetical protein BN970_04309 [Mycolicibacterium conceptionense]
MNVAPDELTGTEQAVLLVLMAESRPVPNPELERLGPKLDKPKRDRLNRLGLIESSGTRPVVHELTDAGWALCRSLFGAGAPPRSTGQGKALYTLLAALHRYFEKAELVPADVFLPAEQPADVTAEAPAAADRGRILNSSCAPPELESLLRLLPCPTRPAPTHRRRRADQPLSAARRQPDPRGEPEGADPRRPRSRGGDR